MKNAFSNFLIFCRLLRKKFDRFVQWVILREQIASYSDDLKINRHFALSCSGLSMDARRTKYEYVVNARLAQRRLVSAKKRLAEFKLSK